MTEKQYLSAKLAFAYCCHGPYYAKNLSRLIRLEFPDSTEDFKLLVGAFLKFEELLE